MIVLDNIRLSKSMGMTKENWESWLLKYKTLERKLALAVTENSRLRQMHSEGNSDKK